ncbi:MAG TPA: NAD(P)-dependent oxidoreductase [Acidimicrobiia bacterium]
MPGDLVLVPELLAPADVTDCVAYSPGELPDEVVRGSVGFFVPDYIDNPNPEWIAQFPKLRVVQLPTVGFDAALTYLPQGVTLCNAAGVHEQSTAELTVGLIIAKWRGIDRAALAMAEGIWDHRRGRSLQDAQVLIIGAGGVGRRIADALAPLGCRTQLVGRSGRDQVAGVEELPDLLIDADVVVLAVPLTSETDGLVDHGFLSMMRDGALLVNVARGPVIVTDDLLAHVPRIEAVLDVVDPEPLPEDHPLWAAPGIIITPHIGGDTDAFPRLARELIGEQVRRWRAEEPLLNVVHGP